MRHPKRAVTRDIRTRTPKRPDRPAREEAEGGWPERTIRARDVMTRPPVTFRQGMTKVRQFDFGDCGPPQPPNTPEIK